MSVMNTEHNRDSVRSQLRQVGRARRVEASAEFESELRDKLMREYEQSCQLSQPISTRPNVLWNSTLILVKRQLFHLQSAREQVAFSLKRASRGMNNMLQTVGQHCQLRMSTSVSFLALVILCPILLLHYSAISQVSIGMQAVSHDGGFSMEQENSEIAMVSQSPQEWKYLRQLKTELKVIDEVVSDNQEMLAHEEALLQRHNKVEICTLDLQCRVTTK